MTFRRILLKLMGGVPVEVVEQISGENTRRATQQLVCPVCSAKRPAGEGLGKRFTPEMLFPFDGIMFKPEIIGYDFMVLKAHSYTGRFKREMSRKKATVQ